MGSTIVIGGGWAGLNCAYELAKAGQNVTVIEAAPQVGGRARGVQFGDYTVDNGQHIALGAYQTLRKLLQDFSLDEDKVFKILPLEILTLGQPELHLRLPKLPAPFNLLYGVLTTHNFTWSEKFQIFKFAIHLQKNDFKLPRDCTISELLLNYNQSSKVTQLLWKPIALAAMSTEIESASAQVFVNILQQAFTGSGDNSNWFLPAVDLSSLLPTRIVEFLTHKQQQVICNQAIKKLDFSQDGLLQVTSNSQTWEAQHIVIATAPWQAAKLLQTHPQLQTLCNALQEFSYEPITTVYLQFAQPVEFAYPMYGMLGTTCQWIFDRSFVEQPDILSVVITGTVADQLQDNVALYNQVLQELHARLPNLAQPITYKIIREKRAAFTCDVKAQTLRPTTRTSIKNLWLCGDYIQNGLPATLEGALLSGKQTSWEILNS